MTPAQVQQFRALLTDAKPPREQLGTEHVFLRGFNEGLECAERLLRKALGEREVAAAPDVEGRR